MFPDDTKSKAVIDHLRKVLPGKQIDFKAETKTFSYVFRIDYGSEARFIRVERSFIDDRQPDMICRFLEANNIRGHLENMTFNTIFISNRGISTNNL